MTAHTTSFIVDGGDYYVANLDNGGVRVGLVDTLAFDFPASHVRYASILGCANESEAEAVFDDCCDKYAPL